MVTASRRPRRYSAWPSRTCVSIKGLHNRLNYDTRVVGSLAKITSELELRYRNLGAFVRARAFYDYEKDLPAGFHTIF